MNPIIDTAEKTIKELIRKGKLGNGRPVAVYPFGLEGKAVKSLLEVQYGITSVLPLDNFLSKPEVFKKQEIDAVGPLP